MKTNRLQEIIGIVEKADIEVFHIEEGDFSLYYEKNRTTSMKPSGKYMYDTPEVEDVILRERMDETPTEENTHSSEESQLEEITSPMIGTFYTRSEPGAEPYVQVGARVASGDTVCVIEAMKLMNEVTSTVNGEIVDILVEDGDVIEYGQPLFTVRVEA